METIRAIGVIHDQDGDMSAQAKRVYSVNTIQVVEGDYESRKAQD